MQSQALEQLTPTAAQAILENLPERIRVAFINRSKEIDFPIEAVIEMALAGYLDSETIGFVDCKPNRGRE